MRNYTELEQTFELEAQETQGTPARTTNRHLQLDLHKMIGLELSKKRWSSNKLALSVGVSGKGLFKVGEPWQTVALISFPHSKSCNRLVCVHARYQSSDSQRRN